MFHLIFLTFINYSGLSFGRRVGASWFRVAALFPVLWHEPSGSGHFVCSKRSVLETALKSGEIPNDFILINSIWYNRTITGARTAHPLISSTRFLSVSSHRNHQTRPFRSDCLLNFPHHCPHRHLCVSPGDHSDHSRPVHVALCRPNPCESLWITAMQDDNDFALR